MERVLRRASATQPLRKACLLTRHTCKDRSQHGVCLRNCMQNSWKDEHRLNHRLRHPCHRQAYVVCTAQVPATCIVGDGNDLEMPRTNAEVSNGVAMLRNAATWCSWCDSTIGSMHVQISQKVSCLYRHVSKQSVCVKRQGASNFNTKDESVKKRKECMSRSHASHHCVVMTPQDNTAPLSRTQIM